MLVFRFIYYTHRLLNMLYMSGCRRHVTRVDYVTTLIDKYYYEEISSNGLTQSLSGQALSLCLNRTSRTFRLYTTSSSLQLSLVTNGLTSELTRTWSNLNPGIHIVVNSILNSVERHWQKELLPVNKAN